MNRSIPPWLLFAALLTPSLAEAQVAGGPAPGQVVDTTGAQSTALISRNPELAGTYQIDTAIPAAPGFAVIGLSPTDVIDPGAARVTFASLVDYLDAHNDAKQGLALGGSPYWWLRKPTLEAYRERNRALEHILARTEVSLGYVKGDSGEADRIGFGFTTELLDSGDYRLDEELYQCVVEAHTARFGPGSAYNLDPSLTVANSYLKEAQEEWDKPLSQRNTLSDPSLSSGDLLTNHGAWVTQWVATRTKLERIALTAQIDSSEFIEGVKTCQNAHIARRVSWTVAGGMALRHLNGDTASDGGSLWTAYRRPLSLGRSLPTPNYMSLFARYDFDRVAELSGSPTTQTYDKAIVALIVGYEAPKWKLSAQAGYEHVAYHGAGPLVDDRYGFYSVSYNYNVSSNVWLELLAGHRNDRVSRSNGADSYLVLNVHWAPNLLAGAGGR